MLRPLKLRWLPKAILALAASCFAFITLWSFRGGPNQLAALMSTGLSFKDVAALICAVLAILLALSLRLLSPAQSNVALLVAASGAAVLLVEVVFFDRVNIKGKVAENCYRVSGTNV